MDTERYIITDSLNINTLIVLLSPAAEAGHNEAQFDLGCLYRDGEGVKVNHVKAVEWFQKGMLL
jgi:TPR repeat protein